MSLHDYNFLFVTSSNLLLNFCQKTLSRVVVVKVVEESWNTPWDSFVTWIKGFKMVTCMTEFFIWSLKDKVYIPGKVFFGNYTVISKRMCFVKIKTILVERTCVETHQFDMKCCLNFRSMKSKHKWITLETSIQEIHNSPRAIYLSVV